MVGTEKEPPPARRARLYYGGREHGRADGDCRFGVRVRRRAFVCVVASRRRGPRVGRRGSRVGGLRSRPRVPLRGGERAAGRCDSPDAKRGGSPRRDSRGVRAPPSPREASGRRREGVGGVGRDGGAGQLSRRRRVRVRFARRRRRRRRRRGCARARAAGESLDTDATGHGLAGTVSLRRRSSIPPSPPRVPCPPCRALARRTTPFWFPRFVWRRLWYTHFPTTRPFAAAVWNFCARTKRCCFACSRIVRGARICATWRSWRRRRRSSRVWRRVASRRIPRCPPRTPTRVAWRRWRWRTSSSRRSTR